MIIAGTKILRHHDTDANRHSQKHIDRNIDHIGCGAHRRQGHAAREPADYHDVYGLIEQLQDISEHQRQRIADHAAEQRAIAHVNSVPSSEHLFTSPHAHKASAVWIFNSISRFTLRIAITQPIHCSRSTANQDTGYPSASINIEWYLAQIT